MTHKQAKQKLDTLTKLHNKFTLEDKKPLKGKVYRVGVSQEKTINTLTELGAMVLLIEGE